MTKMKKGVSILFSSLLLPVLIPSAPAKAETTTDVVYFEDGSYVVTILQEYSASSTNQKMPANLLRSTTLTADLLLP